MRFQSLIVVCLALALPACEHQMPQSALERTSQVDTVTTMPAAYAMATPQAPVIDLSKSANPCARSTDDAITQLEKLMAAKGAKPYVSAAAY